MKLSEVIKKLTDELNNRGDCELVTRHAPTAWIPITNIEIYKTPYTAPENSGYLEITSENP